ncbi:MAG: biopolymer transporter ExbD [Niabella sp.]
MPKVKISKKPGETDMTPFVDVAFLILSFFIMATKFKPQEPVPIETPNSVSSQQLPDNNAIMISIDKENKVYFSVRSKSDPKLAQDAVQRAAEARGITLSPDEVKHYTEGNMIGMPFSKLKAFLALSPSDQAKVKQDGIPVMDSTNNELFYWIGGAKQAFSGEQLKFLIKGDAVSMYPTFKAVVDALKKNDEQKYNLVTMPEEAPRGTDLYKERLSGSGRKK